MILSEILKMLKLSISINSGISAYRFSFIALQEYNYQLCFGKIQIFYLKAEAQYTTPFYRKKKNISKLIQQAEMNKERTDAKMPKFLRAQYKKANRKPTICQALYINEGIPRAFIIFSILRQR